MEPEYILKVYEPPVKYVWLANVVSLTRIYPNEVEIDVDSERRIVVRYIHRGDKMCLHEPDETLCSECKERVDEKDRFECAVCGCNFAVIDHEKYPVIHCPVCMTVLKSISSTIKYVCDECGNVFSSEREPHICPNCGGENIRRV